MSEHIAKVCKYCQELKPIEEFARRAKSADGYQYMCKACRKKYDRERAYELKNTAKERRTAIQGKQKYCPGCKRDLPLAYFYTNYKNNDGYSFYCRECTIKKIQKRSLECDAAKMDELLYAPHAIGEAEKRDKKALRKHNKKSKE